MPKNVLNKMEDGKMIRFVLIFLFLFNMSFAFQLRFGDRQEEYRIVFQMSQESEFDIFQIKEKYYS